MIASARSSGGARVPRTSQVRRAPGECARFTHRGRHGTIARIMDAPGTTFVLEVNPRIPRRLARLVELANNLWYSWDRPTRALFRSEERRVGKACRSPWSPRHIRRN